MGFSFQKWTTKTWRFATSPDTKETLSFKDNELKEIFHLRNFRFNCINRHFPSNYFMRNHTLLWMRQWHRFSTWGLEKSSKCKLKIWVITSSKPARYWYHYNGGSRPWAKGAGAVFLRCCNKIYSRISLALPVFLPSAFFHYFIYFFCQNRSATALANQSK